MKSSTLRSALLAAGLFVAAPALAAPPAGATAAASNKTITDSLAQADDLLHFIGAIESAGLVDKLRDPGPYTVFAPSDTAFAKLPVGTMDKLLDSPNADQLAAMLTYHIVAGRMTSQDIAAAIKAGHGKAELKTLQGGPLTATMKSGKLMLTDAKGGRATVTRKDMAQSNGVIDVIDSVLMP